MKKKKKTAKSTDWTYILLIVLLAFPLKYAPYTCGTMDQITHRRYDHEMFYRLDPYNQIIRKKQLIRRNSFRQKALQVGLDSAAGGNCLGITYLPSQNTQI